MSTFRKIIACISIAGASALAATSPASAAPIKDQGKILIRVEGHREDFGTLASPYHSESDYSLAVTVAGEGVFDVLARRLTADNGESLDDPPRATTTRFRLTTRDRTRLQALLAGAHVERQPSCHTFVQFLAEVSSESQPRQRLVWFGNGSRHEFDTWHGSECSDEVVTLLRFLAGLAAATYVLPQER